MEKVVVRFQFGSTWNLFLTLLVLYKTRTKKFHKNRIVKSCPSYLQCKLCCYISKLKDDCR